MYDCGQAGSMVFMRKFLAVVCLAALLLAAASPLAHGLAWALVVALCLSLDVLAVTPIYCERERVQLPPFPFLSFSTPRGPPQA
jgi:hypothetical protein